MQDAEHLYRAAPDTIDHHVRQAGQHKLPGPGLAARSPEPRMIFEARHDLLDPVEHGVGGGGIVASNVVEDREQIATRASGPQNRQRP